MHLEASTTKGKTSIHVDLEVPKVTKSQGSGQGKTILLEILHTHLIFIFPKVFPIFISHYSVSYSLGRIFLFLHSMRIFSSIHTSV